MLLTAAAVLWLTASAAKPALDRSIEALGSPDAHVRAAAAEAILARGDEAIPALIDALNVTETNYEAQRILVQMGARAVPALIDCAHKPEGSFVWWSCPGVLCRIGAPAEAALQKAAQSSDPKIKARALVTITRRDKARNVVLPALKALSSADPEERRRALVTAESLGSSFGGLGLTALVPPIVRALEDPDRENRLLAVPLLGHIGPAASGAVPALASLYAKSGDDPEMRVLIVEAIGEIGAIDAVSLSLLKRALLDGDDHVRSMAVNAIWVNLGKRAESLAPVLIESLATSKPSIRREIVAVFRDLYEDVDPTPILRQALHHPSFNVRFAAAQLVAYEREERGPELAVPILIEGLELRDPEDRWNALDSLTVALGSNPRLSPADATTAMHFLLLHGLTSQEERVRQASESAIDQINQQHAGDVVPVVVDALASPSAAVRVKSAEMLAKAPNPGKPALAALLQAATDADGQVRSASLRAFAAITKNGPIDAATIPDGAVPALILATRDASPDVRTEAAEALTGIAPADITIPLLVIRLDDDRAGDAFVRALAIHDESAPWAALAATSEEHAVASRGIALARSLSGESDAVKQLKAASGIVDPLKSALPAERSELARIGAPAAKQLIAALAWFDAGSRRSAMRFLSRVSLTPDAIPEVRRLTGDADDAVRLDAAVALLRLGMPGCEALAAELANGPERARETAAFALARQLPGRRRTELTPATVAVPALSKALGDANAEVRRAAAASLGSFDVEAIDAAARLLPLLGDRDRQVRLAAGFALRRVDAFGLHTLAVALTDSDPLLRLGAAETLGALHQRGRDAERTLLAATRDRDAAVGREAASALRKVAVDAHEAGWTTKGKRLDPAVVAIPRAIGSDSAEVTVVVDAGGRVEDVWIVRGNAEVNDLLLAAVQRWRYEASTVSSQPVTVMLHERVALEVRP